MNSRLVSTITAVVCALSLFLNTVSASPYTNELSEKDRLAIIHNAAQIIKTLWKQRDFTANNGNTMAEKRNSGMLDAVINMPDLFKVGRK